MLLSRRHPGHVLRCLALVLPLAVLSACEGSPEFRTSAGEVRDAEVFLEEVTSAWTEMVTSGTGTTSQLRIADGAQCYFAYEPEDERLLGSVACGPVRRIDTADEEIWDLAYVEAEPVADRKEAVLRLLDSPPDDELVAPVGGDGDSPAVSGPFVLSRSRPTAMLVDGKGDEAAEVVTLALPDLPPLPLEQLESVSFPDVPDADELIAGQPLAQLSSPAGAVGLFSTTQVDRVFGEDGLWWGPPEGHTLHHVVISDVYGPQYDDTLASSLALVSASGIEDLGAVTDLGYGDPYSRLLAVEDGTAPTLELTSEGRTWVLDLVTGTADSPEQDIWQKVITVQGVDPDTATAAAGSFTIGGSTYDWDVTVDAFVSPYLSAQYSEDSALGWADEGQMWLWIGVEQSIYDPGCTVFCGVFDDLEDLVTVSVDGADVDPQRGEYGDLWVQVPSDTTSAVVETSRRVTEGDESKTVGVATIDLTIG